MCALIFSNISLANNNVLTQHCREKRVMLVYENSGFTKFIMFGIKFIVPIKHTIGLN